MEVPLDQIVHRTSQATFQQISLLIDALQSKTATDPVQASTERREALLEAIFESRTRLLRLLAVIKAVPLIDKVKKCRDLASDSKSSQQFGEAAQRLRLHHYTLHSAKVPPYAVSHAVEVLGSGTCTRFPQIVNDFAQKKPANEDQNKKSIEWLNRRLNSALIDTKLPMELTSVKIANGRLWLKEERLYEISVTFSGPNPTDPWRLLSLDVLVAPEESSEGIEATRIIGKDQIPLLHAKLTDRLNSPTIAHPLFFALMTLRGFCLELRLQQMIDEAQRYQASRWKGLVKIRGIKNFLQMYYWVNGKDLEESPRLQIGLIEFADEVESAQCSRNSFRVTHIPALMDPVTGETAIFSNVGQSVPQLFERAVTLHMHHMLNRLIETLKNNGIYPSGIKDFDMYFDEASTSEIVLNVNYRPPEGYDGTPSPEDSTNNHVSIKIFVDKSCGCYVINCTKYESDESWVALASDLSKKLSDNLHTAPSVFRSVRLWLRLQFLATVSTFLPVTSQRNVPTIDLSSRHDRLCLRFKSYDKFYLLVEIDMYTKVRFRLLQIQPDDASPVEYAIESTDLEAMDTPPKRRKVDLNTSIGDRDEIERAINMCENRIPMHILSQNLVQMDILHTVSMPNSRILLIVLPHPENMIKFQQLVDTCVLVVENGKCRAEVRLKAGVLQQEIMDTEAITAQNINFDTDKNLITYIYDDILGAVNKFVDDWVGTCAIYEVFAEIAGKRKQSPVPNSSATFSFSSAKFQIAHVPGTFLKLETNPDTSFKVTFVTDNHQPSTLTLVANRVAEQLDMSLDITSILADLPIAIEPLNAIVAFLTPIGRDCSYIPTGSTTGQIVYKGVLVLGLRFLPNKMILIDNGPDADGQIISYGIPSSTLKLFFTKLNGQDDGVKQVTNSASAFYISQSRFNAAIGIDPVEPAKLCHLLKIFYTRALLMSELQALRSTATPLPEDNTIVDFRFNPSSRAFRVSIRTDLSVCDLAMSSGEKDWIDQNEIDTLIKFFQERVSLTVGPLEMKTFVQILTSPTSILKTLIEIMGVDLERGSMENPGIALPMVVPGDINAVPLVQGVFYNPVTPFKLRIVLQIHARDKASAEKLKSEEKTVDTTTVNKENPEAPSPTSESKTEQDNSVDAQTVTNLPLVYDIKTATFAADDRFSTLPTSLSTSIETLRRSAKTPLCDRLRTLINM